MKTILVFKDHYTICDKEFHYSLWDNGKTSICEGFCNCICSYNPEPLKEIPLGMFHCPECEEMVVAGLPHPK